MLGFSRLKNSQQIVVPIKCGIEAVKPLLNLIVHFPGSSSNDAECFHILNQLIICFQLGMLGTPTLIDNSCYLRRQLLEKFCF